MDYNSIITVTLFQRYHQYIVNTGHLYIHHHRDQLQGRCQFSKIQCSQVIKYAISISTTLQLLLTSSFCLSSSFSALSAFFASDSTSFSCVTLSTSDIAVAI